MVKYEVEYLQQVPVKFRSNTNRVLETLNSSTAEYQLMVLWSQGMVLMY